jgi:hypothetical protein
MAHVTEFGFKEEISEETLGVTDIPTNWPAINVEAGGLERPLRWRLVYEVSNHSIEDMYFKAIDYLKDEHEFHYFDKLTDIFAAAEQSAFFGVSQQRLGLQQDKVSQFLATIGKMVKELFQLVRELRILDERLEYYTQSMYMNDLAAEITLKGYWIDLVEGGAKNPASVYGMSRELGFTTLPDIFFAAPPMVPERVDAYLKTLDFNPKLIEVLSRKLKTYLVWKRHTFKELKDRRMFTIKYLRQHYDIIKMYMNWVKPYLKNIKRMNMDQSKLDTPHLISAFEGSMIEIEVLGRKEFKAGGNKAHAVYSLHFDYRARPEMKYVQEGYQRGPTYVGRTIFTLRPYVWTEAELIKYKAFRSKDDFDLLGTVDASVQAAYTALGDELEKYLKEAGEDTSKDFAQPHAPEPKREGILDPFLSLFHLKKSGQQGKKPTHLDCHKCKARNDLKALFCQGCGEKFREQTKKEAFDMGNAMAGAKKHCQGEFYTYVKRIKAAYKFLY